MRQDQKKNYNINMKKNLEDIPIIRYTYDEDDDETFRMVAYTANPAILSKGYIFNDTEKDDMRSKCFSDDEKQEIIAPLIIPDVEMNPRMDWIEIDGKVQRILHRPIFTNEDIDVMYRAFMRKLSTTYVFNLEHRGDKLNSYFFEIWRKEFESDDKSNKYGLKHPVGTVYMKAYIADKELYNKLKSLGASGFSIEGLLATKPYKSFSDDVDIVVDMINSLNEKQFSNLLDMLKKHIEG